MTDEELAAIKARVEAASKVCELCVDCTAACSCADDFPEYSELEDDLVALLAEVEQLNVKNDLLIAELAKLSEHNARLSEQVEAWRDAAKAQSSARDWEMPDAYMDSDDREEHNEANELAMTLLEAAEGLAELQAHLDKRKP